MSVSFASREFKNHASAIVFLTAFAETRKLTKKEGWHIAHHLCRTDHYSNAFGIATLENGKFGIFFSDKYYKFVADGIAAEFDKFASAYAEGLTQNQIAEIVQSSKANRHNTRLANRIAEYGGWAETQQPRDEFVSDIDCPIENLMRLANDIGLR